MTITVSLDEFLSSAGRQLEPSDWLLVDQQRINRFADATNDHQFIHVDPDRAAHSAFGGTIAHGFLTLSLLSFLNSQKLIIPEHLVMALNYGSDRVRFLLPVNVNDRVRSQQQIIDVSAGRKAGHWLLRRAITVEIENRRRPAMTAETLTLYVVER